MNRIYILRHVALCFSYIHIETKNKIRKSEIIFFEVLYQNTPKIYVIDVKIKTQENRLQKCIRQ